MRRSRCSRDTVQQASAHSCVRADAGPSRPTRERTALLRAMLRDHRFPAITTALTRVLVAGIAFLRTCGRTPRPQPHRPVAGRGCAVGLTLVQLPASAAIALACVLVFEDWQGLWRPMSASAAVGIVFLGAIATGGAFLALSSAQTRLDSTTTAVILTLEPVVGASLGIALGDTWTGAILAGGIAVLTAVVLVARTGGLTVSVTELILERTLNRVRQQIRRPHL